MCSSGQAMATTKNRAGLTANEKKSAVLRCQDIGDALRSLLFDILNGKAYCKDLDKVANLIDAVYALRDRFEYYPELAVDPNESRIRELIDAGYPMQSARLIAKDEAAGAPRLD